MDKTSWLKLMTRLDFGDNIETFNKLLAKYNEKHRHYHNVNHIEAVLKHLEKNKHLAKDYKAIELALWFHDAIYKVFSSSNELDSANWARDFLQNNGVENAFIDKVHTLIMATLHDASPVDSDEKLMVDIDLSILGSTPNTYHLFEGWIRKEYKLVPSLIYKKKRKEILTKFLDRKRIYSHEYFYEKLENNARKNISQAILDL